MIDDVMKVIYINYFVEDKPNRNKRINDLYYRLINGIELLDKVDDANKLWNKYRTTNIKLTPKN